MATSLAPLPKALKTNAMVVMARIQSYLAVIGGTMLAEFLQRRTLERNKRYITQPERRRSWGRRRARWASRGLCSQQHHRFNNASPNGASRQLGQLTVPLSPTAGKKAEVHQAHGSRQSKRQARGPMPRLWPSYAKSRCPTLSGLTFVLCGTNGSASILHVLDTLAMTALTDAAR